MKIVSLLREHFEREVGDRLGDLWLVTNDSNGPKSFELLKLKKINVNKKAHFLQNGSFWTTNFLSWSCKPCSCHFFQAIKSIRPTI